jgi:hypothetical protein
MARQFKGFRRSVLRSCSTGTRKRWKPVVLPLSAEVALTSMSLYVRALHSYLHSLLILYYRRLLHYLLYHYALLIRPYEEAE